MKDVLFVVAFSVITLFVLFNGVLMVINPRKHAQFADWLARSDGWSKPNPGWKPGPELEKRLAGLVAIAAGIFMLRFPIGWAFHQRQLSWTSRQPGPRGGFHWFEFGGAVTILGIGLCLITKPEVYARWMIRISPQRLYPGDFIKRSSRGIRIFGTMVVVLGIFLLYFSSTA